MVTRDNRDLSDSDLEIRKRSSCDVWDFENAFYWFSHPTRLNKLLAHYDLYKSIVGIPGHIVELGVYKGASLIRLATFRNLLENDFARKLIGFDAFGAFPTNKLKSKKDIHFVSLFEDAGGDGLDQGELEAIFKRKSFRNVSLIKGDVFETLPVFLKANPEMRIAFLHLDMDVKAPTLFALNKLYELVVPGGLIVIDDYNAVAGATEAVDEFLAKKKLHIEKSTHYNVPSFIRKQLDERRAI